MIEKINIEKESRVENSEREKNIKLLNLINEENDEIEKEIFLNSRNHPDRIKKIDDLYKRLVKGNEKVIYF